MTKIPEYNGPGEIEEDVPSTEVEVEDKPERNLTTQETALRLGMSVPWVKLHAREIGGRLTPRGYRFPAEITIETVSRRVTLRHSTKARGVIEQEKHAGEIARAVFTLLDQGMLTRQIVQELRLPPSTVRQLALEWIECGRFDEGPFAIAHGKKGI